MKTCVYIYVYICSYTNTYTCQLTKTYNKLSKDKTCVLIRIGRLSHIEITNTTQAGWLTTIKVYFMSFTR